MRKLLCLAISVVFLSFLSHGHVEQASHGSVVKSTKKLQTIFLIVFENQNWSSIKANPDAKYINSKVLPLGAYTEQYYTPRSNHPSLPNYLWLESGQNWGIVQDKSPAKAHLNTDKHLVRLFDKATPPVTWRSYQEDITGDVCPLTDFRNYRTKHNPFVYFDDVTDKLNPDSIYCKSHIRPLSELQRDLNSSDPNAVSRYNFIIPNICHSMHHPCGPSDGDHWLAQYLPQILESGVYKDAGVVFVTWDEGTNDSDGPMGLIAISPLAKLGPGKPIHYTHSSLLKTIQEIFDVKPLLGDADSDKVQDLRDLFITFP